MKMNVLMIMAVAALSVVSCGKAEKAVSETVKADEVAQAEAAANTVTNATEAIDVATGSVMDLDNDNAYRPETKVDVLTVLDFNATWCGPCKMLHPVFEATAKSFAGKVRFVSVDIDKLPETASAFEIQAVPTVVIMRPDGKTLRFVGTQQLLPAENFDKIIRQNL